MKTVVQAGQSLFDVAIQEYGTVEAVMLLAKSNNRSMTDALTAGQVLEVPNQVYDRKMGDYCKNNGVCPATAETTESDIRLKIFTEQFTKQFR